MARVARDRPAGAEHARPDRGNRQSERPDNRTTLAVIPEGVRADSRITWTLILGGRPRLAQGGGGGETVTRSRDLAGKGAARAPVLARAGKPPPLACLILTPV